MDRRTLVRAAAATLVVAPLGAMAQEKAKVRRIGFLAPGMPGDRLDDADPRAPWAPLRELGWVQGKNLVVEYRSGQHVQLPRLAEELVALKVELIVAGGTDASLAAYCNVDG